MADKSFGVKELNLLNASGTPTVTSPNNLNLNANTVAISTSCTIGNNLTVTSTTNSANLNVTGIGTLTRAFATDLSVSGVTTITVPANANPHSSWDVVNNSASSYRFTGPGQDGAEDNPNIYLVRGQRYVFKMNASGHPFQIRVANAGAAYSDGVTNNGSQTGNVVFNVQHDAPAQLFYQCTSHGSMVGNIYIVGGPQVISGVVTATTFVGNLTGNPTGSGANLTNLPAANLTGTLPAISGANLTSLPAQATLNNNADNRVITGGSGVNLYAESGFTYDGTIVQIPDRINLNTTGTYIKSNQIAFNPTGTAYLDHYRTGQDIQIRMSTSSSLDTTGPTFKSNGNLAFASGKGIDFSATGDTGGMSSELLDDYEEGSFTPTYSNTGGVTPAYNYREGLYTKIGNIVTCAGIIGCTNANSFGTSMQLRIDLPFTCAANTYGMAGGTISDGAGWQNVASGNYLVGPLISGGQSYGRLVTL